LKCLTLSENNRPSTKAEVDVQQAASIRLKAESSGGVNLTRKVKLHWGNDYSRVLAQLPVDVPVRRSPGGYGAIGYGAIESYVSGASWSSRGTAHSGGPSVTMPPSVECSNRRTLLETEEDPGRLRIDGIRELNHPNALALQRTLNAVLTDAVKTIELDLSQTVLMDSQGLG